MTTSDIPEIDIDDLDTDHVVIDGFVHQLPDLDPQETQEWVESLDAVHKSEGSVRTQFILAKLMERGRQLGLGVPSRTSTPYINTIPPEEEPEYPGDLAIEARVRKFIRWNAAVMVVRANHKSKGIGGHLSTFASSAFLYEVGLNHFFRGKNGGAGDAIYYQGHAAPGVYARAYLEGRLDEDDLDGFRMEVDKPGLSSYPHPRLMPEFWEYPTVSMGLGPINSIYQARFNRYLHNRSLDDTSGSRVWCFIGDGETDEPESLGAISLAAREKLDNLVWVVNCNLQRLDGPVRGNGKIIQELEANFRGAGWNVIKVIWGSSWDDLLAKDLEGVLVDKMNTSVDGEYQRYKAEDGAYVREHFFGPDPRLRAMVEHMSDEEVWALRRGGLDPQKIYAAYDTAISQKGAPTVILAKTIKGYTLGPDVEGKNATHQIKDMTNQQLKRLRDRLGMTDLIEDHWFEGENTPPYYRPPADSIEYQYMMERRKSLGGLLPSRPVEIHSPITLPADQVYEEVYAGSGKAEASTTIAFVRLLRSLTRDENFGARVVPIVPDEARTFGMESMFKDLKIYASQGQLYEPVDHDMLLSYEESQSGQILEEGITEAGSIASWTAAATSYATRGVPMAPFFIFYSMFGFQRVGDAIWAAADARARGFLLGATAGRTTLNGEGLQHEDGHSLLLASTVPPCQAYDPAFAYETGVIIKNGLERMYGQDEDVFFYLTLYNENYVQPPKPEGVDEGIMAGLYRFALAPEGPEKRATILFSGSANLAAREAQTELAERWGVAAELWSATSYKKLREDALAVERWNRLHPHEQPHEAYITQQLNTSQGPVVAVTDFMTSVADQVSRWIPRRFIPLGTDGFGRSDTRARLRRFFETDSAHVVVAVLRSLAADGEVDASVVADAMGHYGIDPDAGDPWLS
jgi:pyruvate dehydrogenase E1 component